MTAIVCIDRHWGIGKNGELLFRIHADLKRFRTLTAGKTVILGRKTLATFPDGRPLPKRENLVLTHASAPIDGARTVSSIPQLLALAPSDAVVIGGGSVYSALLPYCDRVYVTEVDADADADTFFPDLRAAPDWSIGVQEEMQEENGIRFRYTDYIRNR